MVITYFRFICYTHRVRHSPTSATQLLSLGDVSTDSRSSTNPPIALSTFSLNIRRRVEMIEYNCSISRICAITASQFIGSRMESTKIACPKTKSISRSVDRSISRSFDHRLVDQSFRRRNQPLGPVPSERAPRLEIVKSIVLAIGLDYPSTKQTS